ncbi:visual system homeobox 2-like [Plakobranchus ocellatus]|uniref:Visual system homeobox 2-like n=1 Tax=Plakobranchus ocellatus TaxID=259542 RepID=A0AAV4C842_9GAST|nr:visual system homeobox 2-like [Plakobranchus ocellatus]
MAEYGLYGAMVRHSLPLPETIVKSAKEGVLESSAPWLLSMYRKSIEGEKSPESNISSSINGQADDDTKLRPASACADEEKLGADFRTESIAALRARAQEFSAKQQKEEEQNKEDAFHGGVDAGRMGQFDDIDVTDSDDASSSCASDVEGSVDREGKKRKKMYTSNGRPLSNDCNGSNDEPFQCKSRSEEQNSKMKKRKMFPENDKRENYDGSNDPPHADICSEKQTQGEENSSKFNNKRSKKYRSDGEKQNQIVKYQDRAKLSAVSPSPSATIQSLHKQHESFNVQHPQTIYEREPNEFLNSAQMNGNNKFHQQLDRFTMKMQQLCALSSGELSQGSSNPAKPFMTSPFSSNFLMGFPGNNINSRSFQQHLFQSGFLGPSPFNIIGNKLASLSQTHIPYSFQPHQPVQLSCDDARASPSQKSPPFPVPFGTPPSWGSPFANWLSGSAAQEAIMKSSPFAAAYGFGIPETGQGSAAAAGVAALSGVGEGMFPSRPGSLQHIERRMSGPSTDITLADNPSPLSAPSSVVAL